MARRQSVKSLELRTATTRARLWLTRERRREAYALLAPIHAWFTEGLDTPDLVDARTLLSALVPPV